MKDIIKDAMSEFFACDAITSIKRVLGLLIIIATFIILSGVESIGFINSLVVLGVAVFLWFACGINDSFNEK